MLALAPQNRFERALSVFLWIAACGYAAIAALCALAAPVDKFDDAIPLLHGTLVQQGRTPNLDFYSFYPPLSLYLNAAAFDLIGRSVIAARLLADLFFLGILLLVVRFFSSRRYRASEPLMPAAVLLMTASIGELIVMPVWEGFALSFAALLTYLISHSLGRYRLWVVAGSGVLTGLALLCRINFGGYAAAVVMLDLLLQQVPGVADGRRGRPASGVATLVAFAVPAAVCVGGVCLVVYGREVGAGLSEFVVTAQRIMALRGFLDLRLDVDVASTTLLPPLWFILLPPLWFFVRALKGNAAIPAKASVPAAIGVVLLWVAFLARAHFSVALIVVALEIAAVILLHTFVHRLERAELSVLLFFCCVLHYFLSRADWHHFRVLPVVAAFLLPLLVMSRHDAGRTPFEPTTATGTVFAVLSVAILPFVLSGQLQPHLSRLPHGVTLLGDLVRDPHLADTDRVLGPAPLPPHWGSVYRDGWELEALRYVRAKTRASEPIFVGVADHSTVIWNDLRMYWLSDRPIGVKMFQLETRVATEAPVQQGIIADLERNQVRWIVLEDADEPWMKSDYEGSHLLDDYIAGHFAEEARFGDYMVLGRASGGRHDPSVDHSTNPTGDLPLASPSASMTSGGGS